MTIYTVKEAWKALLSGKKLMPDWWPLENKDCLYYCLETLAIKDREGLFWGRNEEEFLAYFFNKEESCHFVECEHLFVPFNLNKDDESSLPNELIINGTIYIKK